MQNVRGAFAAFCLGLTVLNAPVFAVEPGERLADPVLEARARKLSGELRCLVCQNQSIDDSNAPLARDLRMVVRERLQTGATDSQVMSFIVERYGEFVLLRPKFGLHTAVLWFAPLLVLGAALAYWLRRRQAVTAIPRASDVALNAQELRRLDEIMGNGVKPRE
jgi:cytochrome c-type biogenesis protein CcmH